MITKTFKLDRFYFNLILDYHFNYTDVDDSDHFMPLVSFTKQDLAETTKKLTYAIRSAASTTDENNLRAFLAVVLFMLDQFE